MKRAPRAVKWLPNHWQMFVFCSMPLGTSPTGFPND